MIAEEITHTRNRRLQALAKANRVSSQRVVMRGTIEVKATAAGFARIAELLEDPPEIIQTLEIFDLLKWVRGVGDSYARSILAHGDPAGPITETREVRALSERQRFALADHLYETYVRGSRSAQSVLTSRARTHPA